MIRTAVSASKDAAHSGRDYRESTISLEQFLQVQAVAQQNLLNLLHYTNVLYKGGKWDSKKQCIVDARGYRR